MQKTLLDHSPFDGKAGRVKKMLLFLLVSSPALLGEELPQPFDPLNRANLRIDGTIVSGGMKVDEYNYRPGWGSYDRDVTKMQTLKVDVSGAGSIKEGTVVEAYFFIENTQSQQPRIFLAGKEEISAGGTLQFDASVKQGQDRYVYLGTRSKRGDEIKGWFVRVLSAGRVVGVDASQPRYEELARSPVKLKAYLDKNAAK